MLCTLASQLVPVCVCTQSILYRQIFWRDIILADCWNYGIWWTATCDLVCNTKMETKTGCQNLPKYVNKRQRYQRQSQCLHTRCCSHCLPCADKLLKAALLPPLVIKTIWKRGALVHSCWRWTPCMLTISLQAWCIQLQAYFAQENNDYAIIDTNSGGRNIGRLPSKLPLPK